MNFGEFVQLHHSKFHGVAFSGFSVTQILREINFGAARSSKIAVFGSFGGSEF